jgi:hypothetical protein
MKKVTLIKALTFSGALPFLIALLFTFLDYKFLNVAGQQWFLTYGLLILSFMAGTLWGQVINQASKIKRIAVASNIITLLAWFAYLLGDIFTALIVIALGFIALYLLESQLMTLVKRPSYYLRLRLQVTAIVVIAHGLMMVCQLQQHI